MVESYQTKLGPVHEVPCHGLRWFKRARGWQSILLVSVVLTTLPSCLAQTRVLTQHNDNARTGLNPNETILTTSNVNGSQFGKLFSLPVDGQIYAQPLYVPNVVFPGNAIHNVLIVATENDSIYAFDADSNMGINSNPLWQASLVDAAHGASAGETPLDQSTTIGCVDIDPQIGVTSTPVIDITTAPAPTIYVEARSFDGSNYIHRLHALDIITGNEEPQGPVVITGTVSGTGDGSQDGVLAFDPFYEHNRSGLLLLNGILYLAFGSLCDYTPFHGWIFAYDAPSFTQTSVFVTTPNGGLGGVWMSGTGLAADNTGSIFAATGNGAFDTASPVEDFGDTILKLSTDDSSQRSGYLGVGDYFTPYDQDYMADNDCDLGSGGVLVLPDQAGSHPHELLEVGKLGGIYLVDRDQMTSDPSNPNQEEPFCQTCTSNDSQIVQESPEGFLGGVWGAPAYWNNSVYFGGSADVLRSVPISNGILDFADMQSSTASIGYPGSVPAISSNRTIPGTGILWAIDASSFADPAPAVLYAYDASNLSNLLWASSQAVGGLDQAGNAVKFATPTIANGKVYVGTASEVDVYGLRPVSVIPAAVTLETMQTQQFTAIVQGLSSSAVNWSISPAIGSISRSTGLYTAPSDLATNQTVTVTATSVADGVTSGTATVNLNASAVSAQASYGGTDTVTQGNWQTNYGADGYSLAGGAQSLPSYDPSFGVSNAQIFTWAANTSDPRALQAGWTGLAAAWYNTTTFSFDVNLTDGNTHQVAVYALDWDSHARSETIAVVDANSNAVLDTRTIADFNGGVYVYWNISGHVRINVTWISTAYNAAISGVFFGGGSTR